MSRDPDYVHRHKGAEEVWDRINVAVECLNGPDWSKDDEGVEWVRLDAVREVVDRYKPILLPRTRRRSGQPPEASE